MQFYVASVLFVQIRGEASFMSQPSMEAAVKHMDGCLDS